MRTHAMLAAALCLTFGLGYILGEHQPQPEAPKKETRETRMPGTEHFYYAQTNDGKLYLSRQKELDWFLTGDKPPESWKGPFVLEKYAVKSKNGETGEMVLKGDIVSLVTE